MVAFGSPASYLEAAPQIYTTSDYIKDVSKTSALSLNALFHHNGLQQTLSAMICESPCWSCGRTSVHLSELAGPNLQMNLKRVACWLGSTCCCRAENDPPSFAAGPAVVVPANPGVHYFNWAKAISEGPGGETGMQLQFDVSDCSRSTISMYAPSGLPLITAANGVLRFEVTQNTAGHNRVSTCNVRLSEVNGLTSTTQQLTIIRKCFYMHPAAGHAGSCMCVR